MTSQISYLARAEYERGMSPIDYAERQVATLLRVHLAVTACRQEAPGAFPGYPIGMTAAELSRFLLGEITAAGWQPPAPGIAAADVDEPAVIAYAAGISPVDYAEGCVEALVVAHGDLVDVPIAARRILGALLNAGWSMPVWPIPEPGVPDVRP